MCETLQRSGVWNAKRRESSRAASVVVVLRQVRNGTSRLPVASKGR